MVHCTVKVVRSVPSQAAAAPSTCEVAPCYTLLTVTVAGREYKVLHADLSSPLLTCDTFLVAKTKVTLLGLGNPTRLCSCESPSYNHSSSSR